MAMLNQAFLLAFIASALAVPQTDEALRSCGEARYYPSRVGGAHAKMPLPFADRPGIVHLLRGKLSLPNPEWRPNTAMRPGLLQSTHVLMS